MRVGFIFILFGLLCQNCANQTQPTGGPKDETPPKLVTSIPDNKTRNYLSKEFIFEFDEYVEVNNAKQQILITPRIDNDYEIKVRRNVVTLEFDSVLDANTTYTISFRESIQDLTEGNSAERLKIAFSTGDQLDSLYLDGYIYNILSGSYPEEATVVLYNISDTTDIFTDLPYYFTQTTDSGKYVIENIKEGNYKLYAFQDYNKNLKAESGKEPYAFYPDTLFVTQENPTLQLGLISLNLSELRIVSERRSGSIYVIKYNKPISDINFYPSDSLAIQTDPEDPTILQIYPTEKALQNDSTLFRINVSDSLGNQLSDTLYAKFDSQSRRKSPYAVSMEMQPVLVKKPVFESTYTFNKPSKLLNSDSLFLQLDSAYFVNFDSAVYEWNYERNRLKITQRLDPSIFSPAESDDEQSKISKDTRPFTPVFKMGAGAFTSIESDTSQARSAPLTFLRDEDVAVFIINLSAPPDSIILQLRDQGGKLIREIKYPDKNQVTLNNLIPGEYSLRAIVDQNGNGKWDPGNYFLKKLPEQIIHYRTLQGTLDFSLRANFIVEETFEF